RSMIVARGFSSPFAFLTSRTQRPRRNDEALDFAGAFVNFGDASVAIGAFNRILAAVAIAAMDLNGLVRNARCHFTGEKFGHGRVLAEARASVLLPGGFANQQACRVNFRGHIGQHELDRLELRDGMAEGEAFLRILQRRFECALRYASGLCTNSDAAAVE